MPESISWDTILCCLVLLRLQRFTAINVASESEAICIARSNFVNFNLKLIMNNKIVTATIVVAMVLLFLKRPCIEVQSSPLHTFQMINLTAKTATLSNASVTSRFRSTSRNIDPQPSQPVVKSSPEKSIAVESAKPGFHPIWVYTGLTPFWGLPSGPSWHSQSGQDKIVFELLKGKKNGYFIDLAANHAIKMSNTLGLERDNGWDGLCIEPNPQYWNLLSRRKCKTIAAVVGGENNAEVMFTYNIWASGIVRKDFDNKDKTDKRNAPVKTVTLLSIFELFNVPSKIDYLSLDVEGAEEFIMNLFPFDKYSFSAMTVERPSPKLKEKLKANGYTFVRSDYNTFGDELWKLA